MQIKNSYLFLLLVVMGCSAPKVVYDYDTKVNFNRFNSYQIFENAGEGLNELDVKRFSTAITLKMNELGFTKNDKPDFYIDFKAKRSDNLNRNTLAIGFGNVGMNSSIGVSGGIPIDNKKYVEALTVEFVAVTETQELFWQAMFSSKIAAQTTPEKRIQHIKEAIARILKGYPLKN